MVPPSAVIVWQLRGFVEDVECFFTRSASGFTLGLERAGERLLEEEYSELRALLARAKDLRRRLVSVGFAPVARALADPEPVLQSLLTHFVREGTTSLHMGRPA